MLENFDNGFGPAVACACARAGLIMAVVVGLAAAPARAGQIASEYLVGPGDRLEVTVFGHDDLSGEVKVDGSGRIAIPLIGQLGAGGKTISQLREEITAALDRDYIINPRVTIEVVNYRPFYILGQVNRPGSYSYVEGMTVRMAIAIAGGFTRRADEDTVIVVRANDPAQTLVEAGLGERVLPGDSIEVERRLF